MCFSSAHSDQGQTITLAPSVTFLTVYPTSTQVVVATVVKQTTATEFATRTFTEYSTQDISVTEPSILPTTPPPSTISQSPKPPVSSSSSRSATLTTPTTTAPSPAVTQRAPDVAVHSECQPGDADQKVPGPFGLSHDQKITLCKRIVWTNISCFQLLICTYG